LPSEEEADDHQSDGQEGNTEEHKDEPADNLGANTGDGGDGLDKDSDQTESESDDEDEGDDTTREKKKKKKKKKNRNKNKSGEEEPDSSETVTTRKEKTQGEEEPDASEKHDPIMVSTTPGDKAESEAPAASPVDQLPEVSTTPRDKAKSEEPAATKSVTVDQVPPQLGSPAPKTVTTRKEKTGEEEEPDALEKHDPIKVSTTPAKSEAPAASKSVTVDQSTQQPGAPAPETSKNVTSLKGITEEVGHVTSEIDPTGQASTDREQTNKRLSTLEEELLLKELLETAVPRDPIQSQLAVQRKRRTTTVTEEGVKEHMELKASQDEARHKTQAGLDTENPKPTTTDLPLSSVWAEEKKKVDDLRQRHIAADRKLRDSGYFARIKVEARKAKQKQFDNDLANADKDRLEADQAEEERLLR
jgi:hypothetical protein